MRKFVFYQDEKVTQWLRHTLYVKAESQEAAEEFVRQNGLADSTDWHGNNDFGGRVELVDANKEIDPTEGISVDENNGWPTIEIQAPDKRRIADNCGNRNYLAESGLWCERAIELIKQHFTTTDEKAVEFVDKFWANDTTDKENLFGFDLWLHGCNPFREKGKKEPWVFTFPIDMDRFASDGEIVAAYERDDNDEREYPVKKMTPDEFASLINDEMFADLEYWVRFIVI